MSVEGLPLGFAYSNNGLSWRSSYGGDLQAGEIFFTTQPTSAELETAFPGYNAAQASAAAATAIQTQYAAALAAGLTVTWQISTALNGTYALDQTTQFNVGMEIVSILKNGTFTNGQTTKNWPQANGSFANFTIAQFEALATAQSFYLDQLAGALATASSGGTPSWPSASVTINA